MKIIITSGIVNDVTGEEMIWIQKAPPCAPSICMKNYGALQPTSTDIMPTSAYLFSDAEQRKIHNFEGGSVGDDDDVEESLFH